MSSNLISSKPWAAIPPRGPLLRVPEAARYIGYSKTQFYALVASGELPKPIKIGRGFNGSSGVPRAWLDAIIAAKAAESVTG